MLSPNKKYCRKLIFLWKNITINKNNQIQYLVKLYVRNYKTKDGLVNAAKGVYKTYTSNNKYLDIVWIKILVTNIGKHQESNSISYRKWLFHQHLHLYVKLKNHLQYFFTSLTFQYKTIYKIQLACIKIIHHTRGSTLNSVAFDLIGVAQPKLVYIALHG